MSAKVRSAAQPSVLMVAARFPPYVGGIETHVNEMSRLLADRGLEVAVLTTDPDGLLPSRERREAVEVRRVRAYPRGSDLHLAPGLVREILRSDAQLIHIQGIHTLAAPLAMLTAALGRRRYVVTFHTGGHRSAVRRRLRAAQWAVLGPLLRRASGLIAVSDFERMLVANAARIDPRRIRVIRNGSAIGLRVGVPVVEDPDLVVSVGRLERYKGHHRAIAALPHLVTRRPGARLRILGSGPEKRELESLAHRCGVADRVVIESVPAEDRDRMAAELGSAGLVVLLSEYEAHPVAIVEALALGRRALVAETSGLTELAVAGQVASVPLDSDPVALAARMDEVMSEPVPPPAEVPSWQASADELEDVYRSLTRRRESRTAATQQLHG